VEVRKQLTVLVPNKPGELAKISETLAAQKVNIDAISVSDHSDFGLVRLLVSDADRGCEALCNAGLTCMGAEDVLVAELVNRPGALAELTGKLAAARINID